MKCPLLVMAGIAHEGEPRCPIQECLQEECAWWNKRFGRCSQAVDAYRKGQEDWRREKELIRKGG